MNNLTNIGTNALEGFIEDLTLVRIPPWWQSPWFIVLLLAVLALFILAGRRWWLKRKLRGPISEVNSATPTEAPHLAALRKLRELRERMGQVNAYEFCTECSLILRHYIADRFKLEVIYQTTQEFLEHAQTSPALGADHRVRLGQYLQFADGVKFGRRDMSRDEMGQMIDYAEAFINSTAVNGGAP